MGSLYNNKTKLKLIVDFSWIEMANLTDRPILLLQKVAV